MASTKQMAGGAFLERVDYEMEKVVANILDPNTKPTKTRKITVTLELTPDDDRSKIDVSVTAKSTLAPTNPVGTTLAFMGGDEAVLAEMVPHIPGQLFLDGGVWKLEAKRNIAEYFRRELKELIDIGDVVILA